MLFGCGDPLAAPTPSASSGKATTQVDRGPVRVTVEVAPQPARLSDEPTLTLSIDYETDVKIHKPPFGDAFGDFIIRDFREPLPETRDDREILRQIYTLEPTTTGPLQVDPIAIQFTDARPNGDGELHTIESEALTVNVLSVIDSEAPSLDDLEGFAQPIDLPRSYSWVGWLVGCGIILLAVAAFVARRFRRSVAQAAEKQLSPRELATQRLEKLWRNKAACADVKEFYVELTDIVRQYIEGTTDVHAPEQTTEEFLREIGAGKTFSFEEGQRLRDFLESGDLVKFAAHRPGAADIEEAYSRARRFVGTDQQEAAA
ncbi:MAG: hypothetical protein CMJ64_23075 [Planctomycetaceae bacterium]|nr:hypothetical protein [Planctomycetaceae bacterium]